MSARGLARAALCHAQARALVVRGPRREFRQFHLPRARSLAPHALPGAASSRRSAHGTCLRDVPALVAGAALLAAGPLSWRAPPARADGAIPNASSNRVFTKAELAKHTGKGGALMYIALAGRVYDVSASPSFSAPGGYGDLWGGRDATVALAKMSLEPADAGRDDWEALEDKDWESARSWENHFAVKFPVVGVLDTWIQRYGQPGIAAACPSLHA
mmetsp:Transcript_20891/g.66092  ORF Transcript_20891/g.66092 Transcript_20891/m.66092 type:complete len:216 (-) Transcript_20891:20-667(-)